jgi:predicted nucleic acid-binding protein
MNAATTSPAAVLVDTDVVSWLALGEGRAAEFGKLLVGHELFISFVTAAEIRTFLAMNVPHEDGQEALAAALNDYAILDVDLAAVITKWAQLRSATARSTTPDDRERRQNDTWIAACALSQAAPLPVVTGNLRDFQVLADASELSVIHPDL